MPEEEKQALCLGAGRASACHPDVSFGGAAPALVSPPSYILGSFHISVPKAE